ncbi:hypothetical protein [Amycolatopsis sp.]|jgi:hypothetical protein|uniref:hypothetical protein n=1 Tax=Amycolatopsis sp. TaxID=37632 RepID=UPI002DFFDF04|nr:hypothetical protein [Amycolatopsis sp.]
MVRTTGTRRLLAAILAVGAVSALASAPAQAATGVTWQADLSTVDTDDVNVRFDGTALTVDDTNVHRMAGSDGYLTMSEQKLNRPANRITAEVSANGAEAEVSVRGKLSANDWTEWQPLEAGATTLPGNVSSVQVRVGLGSGSSVSSLRLTADQAPQVNALAAATAAKTYRVFATREGLVGGTTANGHKITARDHFVSFPSGKSLSGKGTGTYTAKVCRTDNSRCEYAPVWEVGPWNERDDYWNPSASRQMWKDLPQGKPEAQAAYLDGYNGGRDDRNRKVLNAAAIDIADGTFWDGLKMTDNAYVNVTYLWTGSGPTGVVTTAGDPMNVRASASTTAAVKGLAANYAKVNIECYVEGETVTGRFGTSNIWDKIGEGHYISDTYLQTGSDLPVAPKCA